MPRNLVVCFDGTNNEFGYENTSVVRLVQVLDRDPTRQLLYYDPGVGTLPEPGLFTKLGKTVSKWAGLAFGVGLTRNVEEAYTYLMNHWERGDQVFVFGFSRGAYQARVLTGLLHSLGLLSRGAENLVPYAMRLFAAIRRAKPDADGQRSGYWRLTDEFRWTFARPLEAGADDRRFQARFLGLWDTVSSVGWVWDPVTYPFTRRNPSVEVVRHAISVDERRCFFRQNRLMPAPGQDFSELWFPGVHSDVGGGYPASQGGLWRGPFEWMVAEAQRAGLSIDKNRLSTVVGSSPPPRPWGEPQHESLRGVWWLAEVFPKTQWRSKTESYAIELGLGRHRHIADGELLHESTLLRIRDDAAYAPPNLSPAFRDWVKRLPKVPDVVAYEEAPRNVLEASA